MSKKNLLISTAISLSFLSGCNSNVAASSEEIVTNMLEAEDDIFSYYGKSTIDVYTGEEHTENITMEEYVNDKGEKKVITTNHHDNDLKTFTYNTGKQLITYDEKTNTAQSIDFASTESPMFNESPKDQIALTLDIIDETHTTEIIGEETIQGYDTYHIKATSNKKNNLLGDIEIWVDKKSWFVLKTITNSGDIRSVIEYKELDLSPSFKNETFKVDIPSDVEITPLDSENNVKTGTLDEAIKALGKAFLIFKDDELTIEKIEWYELKGELNRTEVTIYYEKDAVPMFSVSVFPTPPEADLALEESKKTVRGQQAEYMEEITSLSWDENGLRYNIMIANPSLSVDDIIKKAETMIYPN